MTDDAIVIDMHVAYFARESGAAQIESAVEDDADADTPAHVYEDDVLQSLAYAFEKFAVSHAACIVVDAERDAHPLGQFFRQRLVQKRKVTEGTSRNGIHSSADAHASFFDHLSFDARAIDVVVGEFEQLGQVFRTVLIFDDYLLGLGNDVAAEVADAESITLFPGINAQKIARSGNQTVNLGCSLGIVLLLAGYANQSLINQFLENLGRIRHAHAQTLGKFGYRLLSVFNKRV